MRQAGLITASVGGDDFFLTSLVSIDDEAEYMMLECERNGKHVDEEQLHWWTVQNGAISRLRHFEDTALVVAAWDSQAGG